MDAARGGHKTIGLAEPDDTAIAGAAEKKQISPVRLRVVGGSDLRVSLRLSVAHRLLPAVHVPLFELGRVVHQRTPDFNKRRKCVGSNPPSWRKRGQHGSAAQEGLEVPLAVPGEVGSNFRREAVLIPDPLEQLAGRRMNRRSVIRSKESQLHALFEQGWQHFAPEASLSLSYFGILRHNRITSADLKTLHSDEHERFRELLREARVQAGLTQLDLASRLGVPQSFVSKYESGERRLDVLELRLVCQAVGVPLQVFVRRLEKRLR